MARKRKLDIEEYKKKLEELRNDLLMETERIAARTSGRDGYGSDVPGDDFDEPGGDAAQEAWDRSQEAAIGENLRPMLQNVNRALEKVEEGTYGICDMCGKQIPKARLKVMPSAVICAKCREGQPV